MQAHENFPPREQPAHDTPTSRARQPNSDGSAGVSPPYTPATVASLQRTMGNAAVSKILTQSQHSSVHDHDAAVQRMTHFEPGEPVTDDPGRSIILAATLDGTNLGHFTSKTTKYSPQDHAEDQLIDALEQEIAFGPLKDSPGNHALRITLQASPCSTTHGTTTKDAGLDGCTERLIELANNGYLGHTFEIVLRAHHLYQPKHMDRAAAIEASEKAIKDLRNAGVDVRIP